jgi:hypothetical protein
MTKWGRLDMRGLVLAGCVGMLGACDSSSDADGGAGDGGGDAGSVACVLTLSGAVTATASCSGGGSNDATTNATRFDLGAVNNPSFQSFSFSIQLGTGDLIAKTYDASNVASALGALLVPPAKLWNEFTRDSTSPDLGTFSLVITDPGLHYPGGTIYFYSHGTLDATLGPNTLTGASGTVTVHITF